MEKMSVRIDRDDRSEGVYKHNERFVFSVTNVDFVKDIIRPQRFYTPKYLHQASRESCYEYLKKHNRNTCADNED